MVDAKKAGPDWVHGCDKCHMGIVDEPPPALFNLAIPHYVIRAYQWHYSLITLCTCHAGLFYLQFCRKRWAEIEATAARTKSGVSAGQLRAREELVPPAWHDAIMAAVREAQAADAEIDEEEFVVPTMHWEPVEVAA